MKKLQFVIIFYNSLTVWAKTVNRRAKKTGIFIIYDFSEPQFQ